LVNSFGGNRLVRACYAVTLHCASDRRRRVSIGWMTRAATCSRDGV
jgi:hypothetical protein